MTVSATIARRRLVLYRHIDEAVEGFVEKHSVKLSCTKGCAACCYQLTKLDLASAIALAEEIRASAAWRDRLEELHERLREASTIGPMSSLKYFNLQRPCVLLDITTRTCTAYAGRPPACRYYFVISDAALCGIENTSRPVSVPAAGMEAQLAAFDTAHATLAGENLPTILGTLPVMLTMAFDFIERGRAALFDPKYQREDVTRVGAERIDVDALRDRTAALFSGQFNTRSHR